MSNISIFEKRWIDLVFEGRNQAYGAYQLRRENPRTTVLALFFALLLLSSIFGAIVLLSSFNSAPSPVANDPVNKIVKLSKIYLPPATPPKRQNALSMAKKDKPKDDPKIDLIDPKIVAANDHPDDVNTNKNMGKTNPETNPDANPGTSTSVAPGTSTGPETKTESADNGAVASIKLDRQPMFPGGMSKFYDYVARKFDNSNLESGETRNIRIFVSFVIEKDGTLTEIRVMNDPGHGLGQEAIRVLKSLHTKWEPGILKGQHVRTLYTLPIILKE